MTKKYGKIEKVLTVAAIGFLATLIGGSALYVRFSSRPASTPHKTRQVQLAAATPLVSLASAASDWRQGPQSVTNAVFFKKTSDCFLSFDKLASNYDSQSELQHMTTSINGMPPQFTGTGVDSISLHRAAANETSAALHKLQLNTSEASGAYPYQQVAFVQLTDAVVRINGYCAQSSDVPAVETALQAVTLNL